ncbi:35503_t:CDS:2 [Gigaspora margarita]|uniref:35503_t:CDS:1 n=1 Tax=Gigaspora margarita TaxID=4874 RepID=A0ABM8VVX7_GIGMA|nr:35503_t:CDS:2 [Gigaspora margarita]
MSFEDFIGKFQELTINKKNDNDPMKHDSNHINFAMQIGNLLQNNNTPFYAEISERWAIINGIVYFFGNNKEVKFLNSLSTIYEERLPRRCDILLDIKYKKLEYLINSLNLLDKKNFIYNWQEPKEEQELYQLIFNWATDEIEIDFLDLFDAAVYFKKDLNGSFYDRYVTMNLPSLKVYSDEIIFAMQKILQATQTILLIFGPYGRECLLFLKQHEQYSRLIPTFKEILDFSIEAKRYFSMYILHYFFMKEVNFEEGEIEINC